MRPQSESFNAIKYIKLFDICVRFLKIRLHPAVDTNRSHVLDITKNYMMMRFQS